MFKKISPLDRTMAVARASVVRCVLGHVFGPSFCCVCSGPKFCRVFIVSLCAVCLAGVFENSRAFLLRFVCVCLLCASVVCVCWVHLLCVCIV